MLSKEQDIAVQPKMALDDLLTRCTDYDDMSLSMDAGEFTALKQHISLLESSAVAELLSLREQLEALKALEPVAWIEDGMLWRGRLSFTNPDNISEQDKVEFELTFTPLFTAAKPEALPRHIFSMLVNELRDVPAIGCKRELIVGVLNRHGVIAEPVGG